MTGDRDLPAVFGKIRHTLEEREGKPGTRSFVRILRYLELYPLSTLTRVLESVWQARTVSEEMIRYHLQCHVGGKTSEPLHMRHHQHLCGIDVPSTSLSDYNRLLEGGQV